MDASRDAKRATRAYLGSAEENGRDRLRRGRVEKKLCNINSAWTSSRPGKAADRRKRLSLHLDPVQLWQREYRIGAGLLRCLECLNDLPFRHRHDDNLVVILDAGLGKLAIGRRAGRRGAATRERSFREHLLRSLAGSSERLRDSQLCVAAVSVPTTIARGDFNDITSARLVPASPWVVCDTAASRAARLQLVAPAFARHLSKLV